VILGLRTIVEVVAGRLLVFCLCPLDPLLVAIAVSIGLRFERWESRGG
jgi:hypothetical protein